MVNKIVDGKQLTVAWHIDDIKISHVAAGVGREGDSIVKVTGKGTRLSRDDSRLLYCGSGDNNND